mgnify:CR=1 FL=1|tara:strand:- start:24826 stop:25638 length:813 start_codon:yes stop_codon:yes gene_type:complete
MSNEWHGGKGSKSRTTKHKSFRDGYDNIKKSYEFRSDEIILQGDTHDMGVTWKIIYTKVPSGSDYLHLGDIGLGFGTREIATKSCLSWLATIDELCKSLNVRAFFIRGNHDATYPEIWESKWSNIFLIEDHAYATFPNGKKVILLAGGLSVDRCNRTDNWDYWSGEVTKEIETVGKCDFAFSHDCPEHFNHNTASLPIRFQWAIDKDPKLIEDCNKQRGVVTDILGRSEAKVIHYAHMHNNNVECIDGVYARCININEIYDFDANKEYKI